MPPNAHNVPHQQKQNNPHTKDSDQNQSMYGMERATRQSPPARHMQEKIQQYRKKFNEDLNAKYAANDTPDDDDDDDDDDIADRIPWQNTKPMISQDNSLTIPTHCHRYPP